MKKRIISTLLAAAMLFTVLTVVPLISDSPELIPTASAITPATTPSGSRAISNRGQLENISTRLNGTFHLTADIDLSGTPWVPIGTEAAPFTGILDGRGFVIRGMSITGEHTNAGLIGAAGNGSVIRNLGVEGVIDMFGNTRDDGTAGGTAGGIVGLGRVRTPSSSRSLQVWPQIVNCYAKVNITLTSSLHTHSSGGLIGRYGDVRNSVNLGNITSRDGRSGGIGGRFTMVINSYNRGNVNNFFGYAGGIIGAGEQRRAGSGNNAIEYHLGVARNTYSTGRITAVTPAVPAVPAVPATPTTPAIPAIPAIPQGTESKAGGIGGENVLIFNSNWTLFVPPALPNIPGVPAPPPPANTAPTASVTLVEPTGNAQRDFLFNSPSAPAADPASLRSVPTLISQRGDIFSVADVDDLDVYEDTFVSIEFRQGNWHFNNNTINATDYARWAFPTALGNRLVNDGFPLLHSQVIFAKILCQSCGVIEWIEANPWSVWVTEIVTACEVQGRDVRICTHCDELEYRTFEALEHLWNDWRITTTANCFTEGVRERSCRTANCTTVLKEAIEKPAHNWTDWRTTPATYTDDGVRERNCRAVGCTEVESEVLPALGEPCEDCEKAPCECPICEECEQRELECECPPVCDGCGELEEECECPEPCPVCDEFDCDCPPIPDCKICDDEGCCLCDDKISCRYNRPIPRCSIDACLDCRVMFLCENCVNCTEIDKPTDDDPTDNTPDPPKPPVVCEDCKKAPCECPPVPQCGNAADPCNNCPDCGFLGGRFGFGRVTDSGKIPAICDALEILRFIIGLDNAVSKTPDARAAAIICDKGTRDSPIVADALAVLRFIIGLDSPLLDKTYR